MPSPLQITKAYVQPIRWTKKGKVLTTGEKFFVQFNPQSLKVNYSNQKAGDGRPGDAPIQFVGKGTTKLSVELLFDVTIPIGTESDSGDSAPKDVRVLTQRMAKYLDPEDERGKNKKKYVPPGIRFGWDAFNFDGVVDSMDETLEFFSHDGKPLRATVSLQISKQEIKIEIPEGSPGTSEQHLVKEAETLQEAVSKAGRSDWQNVAEANGIENPRRMETGELVDLNAGTGPSGDAVVGVAAPTTGGPVARFSISAANKLNAGVAAGLGFGAAGQVRSSTGVGADVSVGTAASSSTRSSAETSSSRGLSTRIR